MRLRPFLATHSDLVILLGTLCLGGSLAADWRSSPYGLHHSPEEIAVWRERAGMVEGQTTYKDQGDVQYNSPADWSRIVADANTAITDPGNDRYDNYDVTQGLDSPITELNSSWLRDNSWPARVPYIDAKEPRPLISSGTDKAAISIMNAGLVYLLVGDDGRVARYSGNQYAEAVRDELLWYANNEWLDFSNEDRWRRDSSGFADRNPGFFIATWLNTVLNAYDYTRTSSVYSAEDQEKIEQWFYDAVDFYYDLKVSNMHVIFSLYSRGQYTSFTNGGWFAEPRGGAWEGSSFVSYGFNEMFSNRSTAQWRFVMRAGLLLRDHDQFGERAREIVRGAHRWFKEWVVFGTFRDGSFSDLHRGSASKPQQGLAYASIAIGCAIDAVDAYERLWSGEPDFESLYDWSLVHGGEEFELMVPSSMEATGWYDSFIPGPGESKGFKDVLLAYAHHFDGTYGDERHWGEHNIDGHSGDRELNDDRWLAPAVTYYAKSAPDTAAYLKSICTRTAMGTRTYVDPESSARFNGSFNIHEGPWGGHPGTLFMFGKMDDLVFPYGHAASRSNPFRHARQVDGAWRYSPWFGWVYDVRFPWVWNGTHHWRFIHAEDGDENAFYVYDMDLGWLFAFAGAPDYFFCFGRDEWIFYEAGSRDPRRFFGLTSEEWLEFPNNA